MLYRYASTIDRKDHDGLRGVLADDLWAQYGNAEPVSGGDAVASWIGEAIATVVWQHHLLSVYHIDIDGDRRQRAHVPHVVPGVRGRSRRRRSCSSAATTSELRREHDGWQISRLVFEILWGEEKADTAGYLALIGGRGPQA